MLCLGKEGLLTVAADRLLQLADLGQCGVLPAGAQEIAEAVEGNAPVSVLVEERERLLVVGRSLVFECVRCHCLEFAEVRLVLRAVASRVSRQGRDGRCQGPNLGSRASVETGKTGAAIGVEEGRCRALDGRWRSKKLVCCLSLPSGSRFAVGGSRNGHAERFDLIVWTCSPHC